MNTESPPAWVGFAQEQAELILEYLRREPAPDPDFIIRHAVTMAQAAELGQYHRARRPLLEGQASAR